MAEYNLTAANNYTSNNILSLDNNTSTNGLYTNVGSINFNIIGNSSLNNPNTALIRGNNTNNPPLLNNLPSPLSNKSSQNNRKTPTTTSNNQINLVNLQQQQQQQQQKNPNRNKKVKDLILDMRLQSQQQQQQQQIQEHQIYHQPMTNNHELSHHHMENNNHQHHQLPPPEMISDQFHFNTSSYFPKPNLNQPQTSNPPLHHHQLDLTPSQQSSNHLMELNLNSASYLNLDDSNTHPSKSITLNCLNSNSAANNNSNIDLIQLLNSTNTTIDDCNNLYNNNPSIQPQIQQNKTLIDLNNHHNNHHHQELIIPYHLHQQQLIQSHHNSTLSQTIHQPHHHLNGVTNGSHDPLCGGNDIDECHGINQHQHQHQHHEPDDNLLLYNILNKLSNQPSNPSNLAASNQLVNTDNSKQTTSSNPATASSVSSTSSLLLLSATNSDYNSSPPQQQQQPASSEKKLDSSEYISLMINQPQQAINTPPQPQNKSSTYATLQPASTDLDPKIQLLPAPKQEKFDNYTSSPQVENNRNEQYLNMNHVVENNTSQQILPAKKTEKSKVNSPNNNNNMMMMINTAANKHEEMTSSASSTSSSSPADNNNNNESNGYNSASHLNKPIASPTNAQMEELNTKELAHRISSELKRYSIPQAVFAQRVLCRSQGTLSDLLRNPKPWSKLKSGRETFRRMFKWLQEPEAQRMNSLRLAGIDTTTLGYYISRL